MIRRASDSHALDTGSAVARPALEIVAVGAGLALFVGVLYFRLLFTNRVLASGDILHYFYPYRDYAAAALREGRIPLWNPFIFLGAPFLANPQAAALYPLHWPLSWLPVTKQVAWSAALHTWLLGMGGYALMRHWRYSVWAGAATALILAGSGFYGGMLGHINQMNGAAWLPWAVLVVDVGGDRATGGWWSLLLRPSTMARTVAFGLIAALILLAGHTQTFYISMFGLGVWVVWPLFQALWRARGAGGIRDGLVQSARGLFIYGAGTGLALLLSGAQLLPTLELSGLGLRSGGLSYAEASSFSLKLLHLPWTLLPSYGLADLGVLFDTLGYTEYVAYVGIAGLYLAVLGGWRGHGPARQFGLLMSGLGLFLALGRWNLIYYLLYRIVPGFDLFRAPARWMLLYTLGMAVLAGLGTNVVLGSLRARLPADRSVSWQRVLAPALIILLALELVLAARSLPHMHPTAPEAVYDLRTAPAHLMTDPARDELGPGAAGRFLSMSTISFDPGDMVDYGRIFLGDPETGQGRSLGDAEFDDLIVALKAQEIIAPNLALLRRLPSIDGFDGGVLPLRRYLDMLTLFLPVEEIVPDGRLREQIEQVPDARLLAMLNVQYIITDKVRDLWFEDVYYDREIGARLGETGVQEVSINVPYPFEATHVDVIGYVEEGPAAMSGDGWTAVTVTAQANGDAGPAVGEWNIRAGSEAAAQFADGILDSAMAKVSGAVVAYRDVEGGREEYLARLALAEPASPSEIRIRHIAGPDAIIRAVTLYDDRTGQFLSLVPSDKGRFQRVHSGDVKIYENLDVLPRAYLVDEVIPASDAADALRRLQIEDFDPSRSAVVEGGHPLDGEDPMSAAQVGDAILTAYDDGRVAVNTDSPAEAFLVLSDVDYPGWHATIDGQETEMYTTDSLFRGVYVPAGKHVVEFHFTPASWRRGLLLSLVGFAIAVVVLSWAAIQRQRKLRRVA